MVVGAVFFVVPFVYLAYFASGPDDRIWLAFAAVQIANKIPIAFRYRASGISAGFDAVGFGAGIVAAVAAGAAVPLPAGWVVRGAWLLVVASWLAFRVWRELHEAGVPARRRAAVALIAVLYPDLPLVLAILAAPAGG
jgi:hypothetical protein